MPKSLDSCSQAMVASLVKYFERERDNESLLTSLTAVRERVSEGLNIGICTVNKIAAKHNKGELFRSPRRRRNRKKSVVDIDDFDQTAIRNTIYEMYKNKEHITLLTLGVKLADCDIFKGCPASLSKVLRNLGFRYNKDDPRRGLMELNSIAMKRITFLRKYIHAKKEAIHQFVYLDETWIFKDGTIGRSWQDSNVKSVKKTKFGGTRFIILHAGTVDGFVPGCELIFSSKTKDSDYHGEMNRDNFLHWFEHQLIANLNAPSLIIMDNTVKNKYPTSNSTKTEIKDWLKQNNIPFDDTLLKVQLLDLVRLNKPSPIFEAELIAQQNGHDILRLPPYHCMFNPIEHIWGIAKNYYRDHVGSDGTSVEKSLNTLKEALNTVTKQTWMNTIRHVDDEIQRWWDREVYFDQEEIFPVLINLEENEESDSLEYSSDESNH